MRTVPVRTAKAKFSEIIHGAGAGEATTITRHGEAVAMIVPYAKGRTLYPEPSLAAVLLSIPHGYEIAHIRRTGSDSD
jgi:prevent-host-death family protein